jgi:hypothetical protein
MEQEVSPTGAPVVAPRIVPIVVAIGSALMATAGAVKVVASPHTVAHHVADAVLTGLGALLGLFGAASPGLRR